MSSILLTSLTELDVSTNCVGDRSVEVGSVGRLPGTAGASVGQGGSVGKVNAAGVVLVVSKEFTAKLRLAEAVTGAGKVANENGDGVVVSIVGRVGKGGKVGIGPTVGSPKATNKEFSGCKVVADKGSADREFGVDSGGIRVNGTGVVATGKFRRLTVGIRVVWVLTGGNRVNGDGVVVKGGIRVNGAGLW
uniref:Uncharacterized protein n=1 Tax=Ditylenchus dipsaci TaxID=166011 RepID=A0A915DGP0_9BILA